MKVKAQVAYRLRACLLSVRSTTRSDTYDLGRSIAGPLRYGLANPCTAEQYRCPEAIRGPLGSRHNYPDPLL